MTLAALAPSLSLSISRAGRVDSRGDRESQISVIL